ncbi:ABC transporter permease [Cohnella soli]|uniref:ABC transporter permease n=1 Tax=Cohnella soli TaxID=425005 RepID=A0ABW0HVU2_9BACL
MMVLPGILIVLVYQYGPMFGLVMAFEDFKPVHGFFQSSWVGLDNFSYILNMPNLSRVLWNTLFIASMKIIGGLLTPIIVSLLLNELRIEVIKRGIQTLIYLPHFLSWIILGGVMIDILSPSGGIVNQMITFFGFKPIFFLGNVQWFPFTLVISDIWKEFGFSTIVFLAALSGINPALYEAAVVDGANRWRQTWSITIPAILPIIVLMVTLSLGQVLNAGFEQVFTLYNPLVYESGDIIDTFVYRLGMVNAQYSIATAVGLFKSIVSFLLISCSYYLAYRFANYRIF